MRRNRNPDLLNGAPLTWDGMGLGCKKEIKLGTYRSLEKMMRALEERRGHLGV